MENYIIQKLKNYFIDNYDVDVGTIIQYEDQYFIRDIQSDGSLFIILKFQDDEIVEDGYTTVNDDLGIKVLSEGVLIYNNL